jgi:rhodanese-related sulfurtransferase
MRTMVRNVAGACAASFALIALVATAAGAQDTPTTAPGVKTVTAEEVKPLLARGGKLYDLRRKASYVEKHIPGAVPLAFNEKSVKAVSYDPKADSFDLAQLPADKGALLVFHSHGPDGWKSYKAAVAAARAGYRNVHWFRGGFAEWVAKGFATE